MARQEDTELQGRWAHMALKMASFLPLAEDSLPFPQPREGSRDQPYICVLNPVVVAFWLMHECSRASVPPGSGEMLPLPSCLLSLAHTLGQVQAWHCPMAEPSFPLPGPPVPGLGLSLCVQPGAAEGACTVLCYSGPCPGVLGGDLRAEFRSLCPALCPSACDTLPFCCPSRL